MTGDEFSLPVKQALANRVAQRCSNPDCSAATSGPADDPERAVNVGVAAHITARSRGGPRYDSSLTSEQRRSASNGIWLCQNHAHEIDVDPARYTVEFLKAWKAEAENQASSMVTAGIGHVGPAIELVIPSDAVSGTVESLLSFASEAIARVGRTEELTELQEFLASEEPFAWWLWTGPAGVGKSRLAVELCKIAAASWRAGFLRETHQSQLSSLQTVLPTLVVVDYASQRSSWLSEALAQLSQRTLGAKVRVLVLEREDAGPWWQTVQRVDRIEESAHVNATMYALPRPLDGLGRDDTRLLIRLISERLGRPDLTPTNVEDIADHADRIDSSGRPLFTLIATMDWLDANGVSAGRDAAIQRLLDRMNGQTAAHVGGPASTLVRNVQTFATALGGIATADYGELVSVPSLPAGLLPGRFEHLGSTSVDEFVGGVLPDILGELFVLTRLDQTGLEREATISVLQHAWTERPDAYGAFVERTSHDFSAHERLVDLLIIAISSGPSIAGAKLAVNIIPLLRRSDHPALDWIHEQLTAIRLGSDPDGTVELVAEARMRHAKLFFDEGEFNRAQEIFSEALSISEPSWEIYGSLVNSRGAALAMLGRTNDAVVDFEAVIGAALASDEARACALNNRADIRNGNGDTVRSIEDRSAVLALSQTTPDRRFIALGRRAKAYRTLGVKDAALADIATILATEDIAVEQKMEARFMRAQWFIEDGEPEGAKADLRTVIASYRNFAKIDVSARTLLSKLDSGES